MLIASLKKLLKGYQLKRAGIRQTDLVNVYVSVVRPVLEYACPVWHTNLPKYLSDNIEMIQKRALKSIFPNKGYDDILYDLVCVHCMKDEMLFVNNILRTCKVIHTNYTICYLK